MESRSKKLALNTVTSLSLQVITVICGFILPRLIIGSFGSDVNGLVNSVSQFLGVITLLDLGVGAVVQSSLYKPLSEQDNETISKIYVSAHRFFKRLATILIAYVGVLLFVYPLIVNNEFGFLFTAALIGAISINSFFQYYFGIVNSLLLSADQKGYIQYTAQIVVLIVNTIACTILIKLGASIQLVKLTTSFIFLFRPLYLFFYVRKHYDIDTKIQFTGEPIKQKWNGMAQHFASYVLSGTDSIVLTIFSSLVNVSIYSVYSFVVNGIFMIITSLSNGFYSYFGEIYAKNEKERLENDFKFFEWLIHNFSVLIFGCAIVLMTDFVTVYTRGIDDANYIQPVFALVLSLAYFMRSTRLPYNFLILAAGHYKQTQSCYIIAMLLNIVISVLSVKAFGLVGIAVGTLIAMAYQTVWMAIYDYNNLVILPKTRLIKQLAIDILILLVGIICTFKIPKMNTNYFSWIIKSCIVLVIWNVVICVINFLLYREDVLRLKSIVRRKIKRWAGKGI